VVQPQTSSFQSDQHGPWQRGQSFYHTLQCEPNRSSGVNDKDAIGDDHKLHARTIISETKVRRILSIWQAQTIHGKVSTRVP
jgi:hypothetical protein